MIVPKRLSLSQFPGRLAIHWEKIVAWLQIEALSLEKCLCRIAQESTKEKCPLQPFQGYSTHLSFVPSQPRETKNISVLCLVGLSLVELSAPFWILPPLRLFLWPEGDKRNTFQIVKTSVQEGSCHQAKTNEKARPLISSFDLEQLREKLQWAVVSGHSGLATLRSASKPGPWEARRHFQGSCSTHNLDNSCFPMFHVSFPPLLPYRSISQLLFSPSCCFLPSAQNSGLFSLSIHLQTSSSPSSTVCPHLYIMAVIIITAISYWEHIMCF